MQTFHQSPTDPVFVQDPHRFYDCVRAAGPLVVWADYAMPALARHADVMAVLKDRRWGRVPPGGLPPYPAHLAAFARVERLSLLNLEGPGHTALRAPLLRAFTARRVAGLAPRIEALCQRLIDGFPDTPFDLVNRYAGQVPVIVIARLLGVPQAACAQLLDWSHAMVAMYRPGVDLPAQIAANSAAQAFADWLMDVMDRKAADPGDDLLSALLALEAAGEITRDAGLSTVILLLNAGHEATVHATGNAVVRLLAEKCAVAATRTDAVVPTVEECLRIDAPLHLFTRFARAEVTLHGHRFAPGDQVALLLGAANRDPAAYDAPHSFRPGRAGPVVSSFGAGVHFCLGAPLARLEMQIALRVLFDRCPGLRLTEAARFADIYHFHGHTRLMVSRR